MRSDARVAGLRMWITAATLALLIAGCGRRASLTVEDAWIRPVDVGQTTAGYLTLANDSADTLVLAGVDAPFVESAQMHQTVRESGMMSMREVDRFAIPPHERLKFAPGGNHVMLMGAVVKLAEGDTTGLELRFADGRRLHVTARVHS
jgi:copper(I)-binding protein